MRAWRIKTARGTLDLRRFVSTLYYFSGMLRSHAVALTLALMATVLATLLSIAAPWPIQIVLDCVILGREPKPWMLPVLTPFLNWTRSDQALLAFACTAVVLIAFLQGLVQYASQLLQSSTAHRIANTLRRRIFKHLQTLSLRFHEKNRTGDLLLRLTGDVTMVRDLLVESLFDLFAAGLLAFGLLAVMFRLSPLLTGIAVAAIPIVVLVSMIMSVKLRTSVKRAREKEGDLISIAGEVLAGMAMVQAFTREDEEKDRFSRMGRSSLRAGLKTVRLESRLSRTVQIVTAVGVCGILYFGVGEVQSERLSPGMLIVFMSYFNNLLRPVRQSARIAAKIAKSSSCADRIRDVLDTQPEVSNRPGAVPAPPINGQISFDHVHFSYNPAHPTLGDICLEIKPGQRVALVGPTGAGKSTIVKLLLRFYDPDRGCIRIDGHDLRDLLLDSLRRQISVVQQEAVLFGTTIGDNIAMGRADATHDDVRNASRSIGIDDWVQSLPQGYNTRVGERGMTLSGGQRQLIALARAALRGGRILVFDEPTTGLDGQTEARVRSALRSIMKDRTTIIISHRKEPLADVDRVIVLQAGRIVQEGAGEELKMHAGLYRDLFAANAEAPESGEDQPCSTL